MKQQHNSRPLRNTRDLQQKMVSFYNDTERNQIQYIK